MAMLETLDIVDWAGLTHAYGHATDVPDQIRRLRSADRDVRDKTLNELYGNIFHQGTRYEASAYAVPFLLELLTDPTTPDRPAVLGLLACLAVGYGEECLPAGYPIAEHRAAAVGGDELLAAGKNYADEEDEEDEEEEDEEEEEDDDDWLDEPALFDYMQTLDDAVINRLGAYIELAAYDAVRAGLPLIRSLVTDADAEVRAAAAHVLAWFPEEATASLPALIPAAADSDPTVAATALAAIGLLSTPDAAEVVSVLESALDDPRDVVRWGAAIGLARLNGQDAGPKVAVELHEWVGRDEGAREEIPFFDGNLRGYAARSLPLLGDAYADDSFTALLDCLPRVSGSEALPVAEVALQLAFPSPPLPEGTPFAALDERQRQLVRVLADSPGTWRMNGMVFGNFSMLISSYGLPNDPETMARYGGLEG
jgi:HEAT repeat protein